ncbi:histidine triad nucleotide-binding protein [Gorillibacterium timonense]|uniref:histidine triad nucleotide-binding protein n=1 Tax=Gorillibacterium timonense TaxID=1689269 RepID=UPI00071C4820|nr:histidine triad nucleotide-binding protein [Gorillibacterium timonense]
MEDCLFCKIIRGELPSKKVYEDDDVLAFWDISPLAPVHVLTVPKKHIESAMKLGDADAELLARLHHGIREVARATGIEESGFRIVSNVGSDGQQTVPHLHFHVIGGRQLEWKA